MSTDLAGDACPPGSDIAVVRADGRFRSCLLELDGHVLGLLSRRGPGHGIGVDVEPRRHTVRVVGGRSASTALALDLADGESVTVTVERDPNRARRWVLRQSRP